MAYKEGKTQQEEEKEKIGAYSDMSLELPAPSLPEDEWKQEMPGIPVRAPSEAITNTQELMQAFHYAEFSDASKMITPNFEINPSPTVWITSNFVYQTFSRALIWDGSQWTKWATNISIGNVKAASEDGTDSKVHYLKCTNAGHLMGYIASSDGTDSNVLYLRTDSAGRPQCRITDGTDSLDVNADGSINNHPILYSNYKSYEEDLNFYAIGTVTPTTATTGGSIDESGATYYYKVEAYLSNGYTVQDGITVSAEASQAAGTTTSTNTIGLSWTAVTGATDYKIYRNRYLRIPTASAVLTPGGSLPTAAQYYKVSLQETTPSYTGVSSAEVTATPAGANLSIRLLCMGKLFVDAETATGWNVVGNGSGIAVTTTIGERWQGSNALKFNKTSGSATAGYNKTSLTSINASNWNNANDKFGMFCFIPSGDLSKITNIRIHVGSDMSNAIFWDFPAAGLVANWQFLTGNTGSPSGTVGTPVWTAFDTAQVLITTGLTTDTITGFIFDAGFFYKAGANITYNFYGRGTGAETLMITTSVPYWTDDGSISPSATNPVTTYSGTEKLLADNGTAITYTDTGATNPAVGAAMPISSTQQLIQFYDINTDMGENAENIYARADQLISIKLNSVSNDAMSLGGTNVLVDSITITQHDISGVYLYSGTTLPLSVSFRLMAQGL